MFVDETVKLAVHQTGIVTLGILDVLHQYIVILAGPDGRQIPQVMTQLTSGMWCGEIAEVCRQSNVVFRVEDMQYSHSPAAKVLKLTESTKTFGQ